MIQILTDSMSDISQEEAKAHQFQVLPQYVTFENESYLDGIDLTKEQFYEKLAAAKVLPKTSQVTPETFVNAFEAAIKADCPVLCILGSTGLSGTYQSALLAKTMVQPEAPIYLIDSLGATISEQILVWEAVRLRDMGESAAAIFETLSVLVNRIELLACVKNLRYLVMGGRLSATKAYLGSTLQLRPMLRLQIGKLVQAGLVRGEKRAFERIAEQLQELTWDESFPLYLAATHSPKSIQALADFLVRRGFPVQSLRTSSVGSIVGTHAGPDAVAIAWVRKAGLS